MTKESIRTQKLLERKSLSSVYRSNSSETIANKLFQTKEFLTAKIVHLYISTRLEVDTKDILQKCFELNKRVVVPKTNSDCSIIWHIEVGPNTVYLTRHFGIKVPVLNCKKFDLAEMGQEDLFAVPLVAFDNAGNRIGYGKGCYDRFLGSVKAKRIGLGFDVQKVEFIVPEDFDILLDSVITEIK